MPLDDTPSFLHWAAWWSHSALSSWPKGSATRRSVSGWVWLPFAFYTPETSTAAGAASIYHYRGRGDEATARPSSVTLSATYTAKDQRIVSLTPDLYLGEARFQLAGELFYREFPDKFFGLGNDSPEELEEDYTSETVHLRLVLQRRYRSGWSWGPEVEVQDVDVVESEAGGKLSTGEVAGTLTTAPGVVRCQPRCAVQRVVQGTTKIGIGFLELPLFAQERAKRIQRNGIARVDVDCAVERLPRFLDFTEPLVDQRLHVEGVAGSGINQHRFLGVLECLADGIVVDPLVNANEHVWVAGLDAKSRPLQAGGLHLGQQFHRCQ